MRQLMAALRTTTVLVVLFAVAGLHNKHPSGPTPPHGGDGLGNVNHKPSSTLADKTLFPPGTTKAQVEGWFKSIAINPDSRPLERPHGDGWVVIGTRDGITCKVTLDKDGSISGGHPVSGEGVTTNPPA